MFRPCEVAEKPVNLCRAPVFAGVAIGMDFVLNSTGERGAG